MVLDKTEKDVKANTRMGNAGARVSPLSRKHSHVQKQVFFEVSFLGSRI